MFVCVCVSQPQLHLYVHTAITFVTRKNDYKINLKKKKNSETENKIVKQKKKYTEVPTINVAIRTLVTLS